MATFNWLKPNIQFFHRLRKFHKQLLPIKHLILSPPICGYHYFIWVYLFIFQSIDILLIHQLKSIEQKGNWKTKGQWQWLPLTFLALLLELSSLLQLPFLLPLLGYLLWPSSPRIPILFQDLLDWLSVPPPPTRLLPHPLLPPPLPPPPKSPSPSLPLLVPKEVPRCVWQHFFFLFIISSWRLP